jgi:high-affinity nickel permease
MLGMHHAADVDHVTAIDSLVRLHNANKRARWTGTGFILGIMASVLAEMLLIIYVIGSATQAAGMIPIDTLDSIVLRSAFPRIFHTKAFRYMGHALSAAALGIAVIGSYSIITNSNISPPLTNPVLALVIISFAFGYASATRNTGSKMGLNRSYHTPE